MDSTKEPTKEPTVPRSDPPLVCFDVVFMSFVSSEKDTLSKGGSLRGTVGSLFGFVFLFGVGLSASKDSFAVSLTSCLKPALCHMQDGQTDCTQKPKQSKPKQKKKSKRRKEKKEKEKKHTVVVCVCLQKSKLIV